MSPRNRLPAGEPVNLTPKQWIDQAVTVHTIGMQSLIVRSMLGLFAVGFVSGLAMFLMQGFHTWGFHLEREEMRWIGGATVGSLGGLDYDRGRGPVPEAEVRPLHRNSLHRDSVLGTQRMHDNDTYRLFIG
jgi:hypothetical protein